MSLNNYRYVYCRPCDLSSLNSVKAFVEEYKKKENQLSGLINNAGVMNTPRSFSKDGIEMHFAVNHLGHFTLTSLLMETLKATPKSQIQFLINLDYRKGSIDFEDLNHTKNFDKSQAFRQSQLANMMFVTELASMLLKDTSSSVSVNAVYPGVCNTDIKRHMPVDKSFSAYFIANPMMWFFTKSAEYGAQTSIFLLTRGWDESGLGKLYSKLKEIPIDEVALDSSVNQKLLAIDRYWCGLDKSKQESLSVVASGKL